MTETPKFRWNQTRKVNQCWRFATVQTCIALGKSKLRVWTLHRLGLPSIPCMFKRRPEVQFPPKLIADLKQSFPSPSQIQAFTWPLAMQGKDHLHTPEISGPEPNKQRCYLPAAGIHVISSPDSKWSVLFCPLNSSHVSSHAGCDWHCRYREWQNIGVSAASFQLLGRPFSPLEPDPRFEKGLSCSCSCCHCIAHHAFTFHPSRFLTLTLVNCQMNQSNRAQVNFITQAGQGVQNNILVECTIDPFRAHKLTVELFDTPAWVVSYVAWPASWIRVALWSSLDCCKMV